VNILVILSSLGLFLILSSLHGDGTTYCIYSSASLGWDDDMGSSYTKWNISEWSRDRGKLSFERISHSERIRKCPCHTIYCNINVSHKMTRRKEEANVKCRLFLRNIYPSRTHDTLGETISLLSPILYIAWLGGMGWAIILPLEMALLMGQ
jgi:hypothetical protein